MSDVIGLYLSLLGAALAGMVMLMVVFGIAVAWTPPREWCSARVVALTSGSAISILAMGAMALAAAMLTPVLVGVVMILAFAAIGYTLWGFRRLLTRRRSDGLA